MPVRIIRNLVNRFWGGGNPEAHRDDSESDNDEGVLRDDMSID